MPPFRLLSIGLCLLLANAPRLHAAPAIPDPDSDSLPSFLVLQNRTLQDAAAEFTALSSIRIEFPAELAEHMVKHQLDASDWTEAASQLLEGFNHIGYFAADGQLQLIRVTGINGNAGTGKKMRMALAYPENRLPPSGKGTAPGLASTGKPLSLQQLPEHSVLAINLDRSMLLGLSPGELTYFDLPDGQAAVIFDRLVSHANGDQTWIGHLSGEGSSYRVILTFSAAGGSLGQILTRNNAYNIEPGNGVDWMIDRQASGFQPGSLENDSLLATSGNASTSHNYGPMEHFESGIIPAGRTLPPPIAMAEGSTSASTTAVPPDSQALPGSAIIDVMAIVTTGFVSTGLSESRLNYLLTLSNQAYIDSEIAIQLRLVHSYTVDYTDSSDNSNLLTALTNGMPPFDSAASLRSQYGADLVTVLRPFTFPAQVSCGTAWVLGANGGQMNGDSAYSVVSDGYSNGYYCSNYTLLHELSHNMGSVHDRANSGFSGIYSYSYGYGLEGSFGTIMSYLSPDIGKFSNPDISCAGYLCGIDENRTDSANNALSLNRVAATVASFQPTRIPVDVDQGDGATTTDDASNTGSSIDSSGEENHSLTAGYDFDGDGFADLLWQNAEQLELWMMQGEQRLGSFTPEPLVRNITVPRVLDVNADGSPDLLLRNPETGSVAIRVMEALTPLTTITYPSAGSDWSLVAAADLNGDGKQDLIWQHQTSLAFVSWLMSETRVISYGRVYPSSSEYQLVSSDDFDLDGRDDLFWHNPVTGGNEITLMSSSRVSTRIQLPATSPEWTPLVSGDFDGDGYADLLWHNLSNGKIRLWSMRDGQIQSQADITTRTDLRWKLAATADLNKDGKTDLLWRHRWGHNKVMLMDGFSEPGSAPLKWMPTSWVLIPD